MPDRRPNILFLMSDEHRPDVAPWEGDEVVRMPVLDELARTGVVFRNAYTPSPICVPTRQCMAAGVLPRHLGVERYGDDLAPGAMTFARRFSQFGYETVCAGKLHHMGADQMQGWTKRMGNDFTVYPPAIPDRDEAAFARREAQAEENRQRGLAKWSDAREVRRAGVGRHHEGVDGYALTGLHHYIDQKWTDIWYDKVAPEAPYLLKLSFNRPHYPYHTDEEKLAWYLPRVQPHVETEVFPHPFLSRHRVQPGVDADEREIRRATAAYYGMLEEIDTDYGSILQQLIDGGEDLDDWIIIYASDHGEMLGEHGIWEKQQFFEASARVPLIIRWPRRFAPHVVEENVNLCDLFATLCELANIPLPPPESGAARDSRSLVPLLEGNAEGWDNETVSQFDGVNCMVKRDHLKYCYYGEEMPEVLFDLERDPRERENFIDDPAYAEALKALRARRRELGFG